MPSPISTRIAKAFRATYERLAPRFGYTTRAESAVAWEDVPENNRKLMVATVQQLRADGIIRPSHDYWYDPIRRVNEWHDLTGERYFHELDETARLKLLALRITVIEEEFKEVKAELEAGIDRQLNLARLAKELADLLYVTYGTADLLGIAIEEVFELVHRNNLTKVDPATGTVRRRSDGKVLKPDGYKKLTDDDINAVLNAV